MKTRYTRSLFVLILILFSTIKLTANTPAGSFTVISNGTAVDPNAYVTAIVNADLESFRYLNKRCVIEFDNGLKVELYSADELRSMGIPLTASEYKIEDGPNWIQPIFHLNADGTLSAMYTKPNLKQNATQH